MPWPSQYPRYVDLDSEGKRISKVESQKQVYRVYVCTCTSTRVCNVYRLVLLVLFDVVWSGEEGVTLGKISILHYFT